jgi:hypothetical protein
VTLFGSTCQRLSADPSHFPKGVTVELPSTHGDTFCDRTDVDGVPGQKSGPAGRRRRCHLPIEHPRSTPHRLAAAGAALACRSYHASGRHVVAGHRCHDLGSACEAMAYGDKEAPPLSPNRLDGPQVAGFVSLRGLAKWYRLRSVLPMSPYRRHTGSKVPGFGSIHPLCCFYPQRLAPMPVGGVGWSNKPADVSSSGPRASPKKAHLSPKSTILCSQKLYPFLPNPQSFAPKSCNPSSQKV